MYFDVGHLTEETWHKTYTDRHLTVCWRSTMKTDSSKKIDMITSFWIHSYSLFEHNLFLTWQHHLAKVDSEYNLSFKDAVFNFIAPVTILPKSEKSEWSKDVSCSLNNCIVIWLNTSISHFVSPWWFQRYHLNQYKVLTLISIHQIQ